MLPPVDPNVLQRNPSFAILYKDLCTRKLNPDGSTRDTKKQRMHDEIRRNLTHAQSNLIQTNILTTTLSTLPSTQPDLPQDLHQPLAIAVAHLRHQLSPSDLETLSSETTHFLTSTPQIAHFLSLQLLTLTTHLTTLLSPLTPIPPSSLAHEVSALKTHTTLTLPSSLAQAHAVLANTAHTTLTLHRTLLETAISTLEQVTHGSVSRSTRTRAELLAAKAALLDAQARILRLTISASPAGGDFERALRGLGKALAAEKKGLEDRRVVAEKALQMYAGAGEKGMRDLGARKVTLKRDIERITREVEKLEHGEGV